jgi:hypothetical protein
MILFMKAYHFILMTLLASVLLWGCKHNNIENQLGPDYCSVVETPFKRNPKDTLDFAKWGDTLSAKISGNLEWNITIKGRTSRAVKRFSGVSADVLNFWLGETDTLAFFAKDEWCDMTFSNNCQPSQTKPVYLKANPNYNKIGYLLDDFEGKKLKYVLGKSNDTVSSIYQGLDSLSFPAIQGKKFLRVAALPKNWYVGEYNMTFVKILPNLGTSDPNEVYLNFLINNNGNKTNAIALILKETGKNRTFKIPADKLNGWNMVSVKLSDMGVVDASKVTNVIFSFGPSEIGTPVDFSLDFVIFTKGKPFIQ